MDRYRQPDIMDFVKFISDSEMIFHRRWGDAPLRYTQVISLYDLNTERVCFVLNSFFLISILHF